ncbi:MAG: hypothetical protein ABIJ92_05525 [Candidatus Aenigmatarchaeota archaeon]
MSNVDSAAADWDALHQISLKQIDVGDWSNSATLEFTKCRRDTGNSRIYAAIIGGRNYLAYRVGDNTYLANADRLDSENKTIKTACLVISENFVEYSQPGDTCKAVVVKDPILLTEIQSLHTERQTDYPVDDLALDVVAIGDALRDMESGRPLRPGYLDEHFDTE